MSGQDHTGTRPVNARIFPIPPVVAALFIAAGWAFDRSVPLFERRSPVPFAAKIGGGALMAGALAAGGLALLEMLRFRTTFHPGREANALVQGSIYKRTRNPMYLSLTFMTLGFGIATANPWTILLSPLLLLYLQERVVKREEAYLAARFGAEYEAYRSKVRRWL